MADIHRAAPSVASTDSNLIELLQNPDAYPHAVSHIELIETHISWVLLTGDYVYKIKKPLDLGFLNFSDLERRRYYCEEEIRLNKPWAPDIYLDVVPITLTGKRASVGGSGKPVEYAVRMRSFDQSLLLDAQLDSGKLSVADMRELAGSLAKRHEAAARTDASQREHAVSRAIDLIRENFAPLEGSIDKPLLDELRRWSMQQLNELEGVFWQRFDGGFFRECHGDLHLGNLVRLPDGITTFDCIEFNDDLRHIDVVADIAFLIMDLVARHRVDLAAHFLNRYLEFSGDYDGMRVFNLYFTYRCLVRAKIAVIRSCERQEESGARRDLIEAHRYCEMAQRQIASRRPLLVTMTGLSGSGKTWVSGGLMATLPAIRVRSDIERKRLFGLDETADSGSGIAAGIYAHDVSEKIYARLNAIAETLLTSGHNVILDASFLKIEERAAARKVAELTGAGFVLLQTLAADAVLRSRVRKRKTQYRDASEAGTEVLDYQLRQAEEFSDEEMPFRVCCESENLDAKQLAQKLRDKISQP